jgi:hypothetical protein
MALILTEIVQHNALLWQRFAPAPGVLRGCAEYLRLQEVLRTMRQQRLQAPDINFWLMHRAATRHDLWTALAALARVYIGTLAETYLADGSLLVVRTCVGYLHWLDIMPRYQFGSILRVHVAHVYYDRTVFMYVWRPPANDSDPA